EQKEAEGGMTDMWNPAKRGRVCASCHVGNAEEGKVVTHAMYAAGHPPLPSFETATFGDAMPRHWKLLKEKPAAVQRLLQYDPEELEQSHVVVGGAVAEFRQAMSMLAVQAKKCAEAAAESSLDLAQYDCYACHHELRAPGWRQKRGYET